MNNIVLAVEIQIRIRIHVLQTHGTRCSEELQFGLRKRSDVTARKKKIERKLSGGRRISFLAWNYPFHRADSGPCPLPVAIAFYGFFVVARVAVKQFVFFCRLPLARRDR